MVGNLGKFVKGFLFLFIFALILVAGFEFASTGVESSEFNSAFTAAKAGDHRSQIRLGLLYKKGMFTEKNDAHAIYWFKRATEQGSIMAKEILCWDYKIGCDQ